MLEVRVVFTGQVQGVGFRATASRMARQLGLKGTVQNLPDGSVEIIAQGSPNVIHELIVTLKERVFAGAVRSAQEEQRSIQKVYEGFQIIR